MRMSNLFRVRPVCRDEMSVDSTHPGIDHVTVVPTNYRPDDSGEEEKRDAEVDETRATTDRR